MDAGGQNINPPQAVILGVSFSLASVVTGVRYLLPGKGWEPSGAACDLGVFYFLGATLLGMVAAALPSTLLIKVIMLLALVVMIGSTVCLTLC